MSETQIQMIRTANRNGFRTFFIDGLVVLEIPFQHTVEGRPTLRGFARLTVHTVAEVESAMRVL